MSDLPKRLRRATRLTCGLPIEDEIDALLHEAADLLESYQVVGTVTGYDGHNEVGLVEWELEQEPPKEGTVIFIRRWTQPEIEEVHRAAEELVKAWKKT